MSTASHGRAESIRQRIRNRFPKQQEAKTLEFKSTLRWNLREERKEPKVVTHVIDVNHSCRGRQRFLPVTAWLLWVRRRRGCGRCGERSLDHRSDVFKSEDKFMAHLSHVVGSGPETTRLAPQSAEEYIRTRYERS